MKFETSCRIRTTAEINTLAEAVRQRFRMISSDVTMKRGLITAKGIEASFGSINRADHAEITIKEVDGGYLLNAVVNYRPSIAFWIFLLVGLFTWVLWILPIIFYLTQKSSVRTAVEKAFERVKNEFDQAAPVVITALAAEPQPISLAAEIQEAKALLDQGVIDADEFQAMKSKILASK